MVRDFEPLDEFDDLPAIRLDRRDDEAVIWDETGGLRGDEL
jgi:hypothetical protein